ncbi:hypothetical protein QTO34_010715 [Cnephaeus nilssonii]|uniref:Nuclear factor of activated T-cells, cytoplasmic 1 n=1 Tax=Cnephaeus nilssonii TaxID=3371016 RepID=A0AA40LF38_CNENI|nr:hypothetical protein QTO34_010715 [Eptesicus nilssonii]
MTTANCGAHDELDFKLVFGEEGAPAPPPPGSRPAGGCRAGRDGGASVPLLARTSSASPWSFGRPVSGNTVSACVWRVKSGFKSPRRRVGRRDVEVARAWLVANELVGNSTPGRPWPVGPRGVWRPRVGAPAPVALVSLFCQRDHQEADTQRRSCPQPAGPDQRWLGAGLASRRHQGSQGAHCTKFRAIDFSFTWLPAPVFRQQQFSSGHPPIRAPPASTPRGTPIRRRSDRAGGQRKTAAGGKLVLAATQSATPSSATSVFRRPHGSFRSAGLTAPANGRREERGSGTRVSPPPTPTASQSATLSPAPRASSRPNHLPITRFPPATPVVLIHRLQVLSGLPLEFRRCTPVEEEDGDEGGRGEAECCFVGTRSTVLFLCKWAVHITAASVLSAYPLVVNLEPDDCASIYIFNVDPPPSTLNSPLCLPHHGLPSHPSVLSSSFQLQGHKNYEGTCEIPESKYSPLGGPKPFECPSIQITSISPNCHQEVDAHEDDLHINDPEKEYLERPSRDHLYLPLEPSYRESSLSPRGCPGEESWHQQYGLGHSLSPRQSPCHSPRSSITDENWLSPRPASGPSSRPTSPCGKRRHSSAEVCYAGSLSPHHSPVPSPGHSPRGSVTEDTWLNASVQGGSGLGPALLPPFQYYVETDIPLKTRKTSEDQATVLPGNLELCSDDQGNLSPSRETSIDDGIGSQYPLKKDSSGDHFLSVPSPFTWSKPKPGHTPIFRTSSLPPLDWPLPTHFGQCELKIEVQPKTHHRAHYETEGSRGAVKASTGGHPVVKLLGYSEKPINLQMFIGTADDRYLRPHAFYQVHRITGKTVATASQEIIIASTKVLEIPLLPENNMSASIDCAGILKLRNSDIELRKGETDIGRKNTRVRLVFRVHIPQPNGKVLSLQTASIPVECSQRSAQELPHIEKYSINSCSVNGGHEMIVTGSNFLPESKIIFLEKGQDGRPQWEVEGKIIREKCQGAHIVLEVPPYHNPAVTAAVQVHFYLCNGKRKKSQSQRFTYTPVLMKQEHREEIDLSSVPSLPVPHPVQTQRPSSDTGHPCDSVLSAQRSLVCPIQQTYASMVTSSHLQQLQCRDESAGKEQHMLPSSVMHQPFQVTPTPPVGSSYQPMQTNVVYNGPTCLPINAASSQEFVPVLFQQDAALPSLINLGCQPPSSIPFHSSNSGSTGHLLAHTPHSVQTLPHLQSMEYHCSNTGQRSLSSPVTDQVTGQPSPQLQSITYGSSQLGSATTVSPAASHPLASSPLSGPPSPQLQPMPYQPPSSGTTSSPTLATRMHSGQHSTQAQSTGQGGLSAPSSLICHNLCDPASFPSDKATVNIKPEPEEQEPNFSAIGLQDITLDDGKFIFMFLKQ